MSIFTAVRVWCCGVVQCMSAIRHPVSLILPPTTMLYKRAVSVAAENLKEWQRKKSRQTGMLSSECLVNFVSI